MTTETTVAKAVSRVPLWSADGVRVSKLDGGLSNRNFKVEFEDRCFVLRIDAGDSRDIKPIAGSEMRVQQAAAAAGIAPDILFVSADDGILVTQYIDAPVWQESDLGDQANLEAIARLLIKVHALPSSGWSFDAQTVAGAYLRRLQGQSDLYDRALRCVQIITEAGGGASFTCCHNDVVAANIVGRSIPMLIDWEYACDNNPMFDLASLICYHDLGDEQTGVLLNAYSAKNDMSEDLRKQIRIFDALQWLWLACRQVAKRTDEQADRLAVLQNRFS